MTRSRFFRPRLLLGGLGGVMAVVALPVTFAVADVQVLDLPGSDHRGVFAELALGSVSLA